MPILLIFPRFLLRNYHFLSSVAAARVPYRTALASITLKERLLPIYLIYNILRRILEFWFKHTRFLWIIT